MRAIEADAMPHVIDMTGQTTIEMLAGVLSVAAACVSNDSGAMHLGAAVGTPLVALFGPTREDETAPLTRSAMKHGITSCSKSRARCQLRMANGSMKTSASSCL